MPRKPRRSAGRPASLPWGEIYPTLDLHGHTGAEARARAEGWLREQQRAGARTVRVITGWGRHSVGPPVLRGEIEALLARLRGRVVAHYAVEPGGGAFRVELRRAARPAPQAGPAAAPAADRSARDAALRRRAEEALWELGVEPTPALVEAELRRLRRAADDEAP
jgi:hypothetical protein